MIQYRDSGYSTEYCVKPRMLSRKKLTIEIATWNTEVVSAGVYPRDPYSYWTGNRSDRAADQLAI
jgi:hypothetical protein